MRNFLLVFLFFGVFFASFISYDTHFTKIEHFSFDNSSDEQLEELNFYSSNLPFEQGEYIITVPWSFTPAFNDPQGEFLISIETYGAHVVRIDKDANQIFVKRNSSDIFYPYIVLTTKNNPDISLTITNRINLDTLDIKTKTRVVNSNNRTLFFSYNANQDYFMFSKEDCQLGTIENLSIICSSIGANDDDEVEANIDLSLNKEYCGLNFLGYPFDCHFYSLTHHVESNANFSNADSGITSFFEYFIKIEPTNGYVVDNSKSKVELCPSGFVVFPITIQGAIASITLNSSLLFEKDLFSCDQKFDIPLQLQGFRLPLPVFEPMASKFYGEPIATKSIQTHFGYPITSYEVRYNIYEVRPWTAYVFWFAIVLLSFLSLNFFWASLKFSTKNKRKNALLGLIMALAFIVPLLLTPTILSIAIIGGAFIFGLLGIIVRHFLFKTRYLF